jgi:DNA-binding CsgD family transcriptional regulator
MPRDIMIQLFGLTPAEARLALFIGAGGTVEEAAHRFHTALSTARSQMRQVLTKTDTHRQADLVRLISRLDFFQ